MIDRPIPSPKTAVPIGRLIATTDPNASSRMITATARPIVSLSSDSTWLP